MTIHGFESLTPQVLLLIVPLAIVQVGLLVLAIVDLLRDDRAVRGGSKGVWAVIIVFVSMIGPILYFLVGREDGPVEPQAPGPGAMPGWGSPHDPPIVASVAPSRAPVDPSPPPVVARRRRASAARRHPSAIVIEDLTKRYPGGIVALDSLTMTVPAGSVFGLLGPNGAGKTTTLRLLAGLTRATGGRAFIGGVAVTPDALDARRGLGYLEQDPRAYAWMTGRDQLRMLGRLHGLDGRTLERRSTTRSAASTWRPRPTAAPAPTRAACGSASGSRARWSTARPWRSSTSP